MNKRNVDVVSTCIVDKSLFGSKVGFLDLLTSIDGKSCSIGEKQYEIKLIDNDNKEVCIGYVETLHNKNLPPKKDKETNEFSGLGIDLSQESLVFANIFLFDAKLNVLLYEVNGNGCYLDDFSKALANIWQTIPKNECSDLKISFPVFPRIDQYERFLKMNYYKRYCVEIRNPGDLASKIKAEDLGIKEGLMQENERMKDRLAHSSELNADVIRIEQLAMTKKLNPQGLSRIKLHQAIELAIKYASHDNLVSLKVQGYTSNPEDSNALKTIDLIVDTYNNCNFTIEKQQLQEDLQIPERKAGIKRVYDSIFEEVTSYVGKNKI